MANIIFCSDRRQNATFFLFIPRVQPFAYTHMLVNTISAFNEHGEIFIIYDNEYVLVCLYSHLFAVIAYHFLLLLLYKIGKQTSQNANIQYENEKKSNNKQPETANAATVKEPF